MKALLILAIIIGWVVIGAVLEHNRLGGGIPQGLLACGAMYLILKVAKRKPASQ